MNDDINNDRVREAAEKKAREDAAMGRLPQSGHMSHTKLHHHYSTIFDAERKSNGS